MCRLVEVANAENAVFCGRGKGATRGIESERGSMGGVQRE
jgi:hypothetical protein